MLQIRSDLTNTFPNITKFATKTIQINGNYEDFLLSKNLRNEEVLICPTDALLLDKNKIDEEKCIDCLLCAHYCPPKLVEFKEEIDSFEKFLNYINSDKKFLTKWIGLFFLATSINGRCGFEVKIQGGQREKRIPLLLILDNKPLILKVVNSFKDIESGILLLNDINELILEKGFDTAEEIVIPNESSKNIDDRITDSIKSLKAKFDFQLISLDTLWDAAKQGIESEKVDWKRLFPS